MKRIILVLIIVLVGVSCHNVKPVVQVEPPFVFRPQARELPRRLPLLFEKLPPPFLSIAAVGDIMLGEVTPQYMQQYGVSYPFDSTRQILAEADLTMGNLEAAFSNTGTRFEKKFTFKVPPQYAKSLLHAGIDVVTLANNHILDFGMEALKNTITTLDSLGIDHCGAGVTFEEAIKPALLERNGYRVAVLGYSLTFPEEFWANRQHGGTVFPHESLLKKSIQLCETLADITIVTFHWGAELANYPKDYQKQIAYQSIDYGADLVIGHHPHVLQGLEIYKNRLIAYSLGNFTFSSYSRKTTESIILKVFLTRNGLLYAKAIPVCVNNDRVHFQPRRLVGAEADTVLAQLRRFSAPLKNAASIDERGYISSQGALVAKHTMPIDTARVKNSGH
ncbi:MAG: CapA family protein [candidate division KSB1 bacterium]|nr:CapA family protein [candidate division KSB1 bacterium]MDZ7318610.1 CapA family protein [candidate division KSB1 bacterium]MDZ7339904.1 CapA family protein [candidate division KSB1 bacterium]